jgi:hypothetical protein
MERIWRLPHFRVHADSKSTSFIFHFPFSIPEKLKRRSVAAYSRLFPDGKKGWPELLVKAYKVTHHDGKSIKNRVGLLLEKIVTEAFLILLEEHKDAFHQDPAKVAEEQELLKKRLIRTGPRPDERKRNQTAIRLAKRYNELLPEVRGIKEFVKKKESLLEDTELRAEIARTFRYTWTRFITNGCVLNNLLPIAGHESRIETFSSEKWTVRQLRVGIMVCEESASRPEARLGPTTLYEKYILPGNELIRNKQ